MTQFLNIISRPRRFPVLCLAAALVVSVIANGASGVTLHAQTTAQKTATPRRPLPKPQNNSRGFEQYAGRDASSRLIAAGATRGGVARKPVAPLEGIALDAHPFFLWEPAQTEQNYKFTIYDGDIYANPKAAVFYEIETAQPQLRYSANAPALEPGRLYSWRVSATPTAIRNGSSGSSTVGTPVNFYVLIDEDAQTVKQAIANANVAAPKNSAERLRQAQILTEYGVWYDALRIARELIAENSRDEAAQIFYESLIQKLEE